MNTNPADFIIIGLDTPDTSDHPLYDERIKLPIDRGLVRAIDTMGVLVPVQVAPGSTIVVDGRRRVIHAREVNRLRAEKGIDPIVVPTVEASVPDNMLPLIAAACNEGRLDDSPGRKAARMQRLQQTGVPTSTLAATFACSEKHVRNFLAFAKMDPSVQAAVAKDELPFAAALKWQSLPQDMQATLVRTYISRRSKVKDAVLLAGELAGGAVADPEQGPSPARAGKKEFRRFATALMLTGGWENDPKSVTLRQLLGAEMSDDFARGILFAIGDLPLGKGGVQETLSEDAAKALKALWKRSTTRKPPEAPEADEAADEAAE